MPIWKRLKAAVDSDYGQAPEGLASRLHLHPRQATRVIGKHQIWQAPRLGRIGCDVDLTMTIEKAGLQCLLILPIEQRCVADRLMTVFGQASEAMSPTQKGWWSIYDPLGNPAARLIFLFDLPTRSAPHMFSGAMIGPRRPDR